MSEAWIFGLPDVVGFAKGASPSRPRLPHWRPNGRGDHWVALILPAGVANSPLAYCELPRGLVRMGSRPLGP